MSGDNFEKTPDSPAIPEQAPAIVLDATPQPTIYDSFVLHGAFHLPVELLKQVGRPVQRSIVVVVQREHGYAAVSPFKDHVLFQDDDRLTPHGVAGFFSIELFKTHEDRIEGDYHVFVSMGEHISNVLQRTVTR